MPDIHIRVTDKIATGDGSRIVCGNSDYMAVFSFDEEWAAYEVKTARFVYPGRPGDHIDVIFEGTTCPVPILRNTIGVKVGVFAGELRTTTSAWFDCKKSVLCESGGSPVEPEPDVYAQLMERLRDLEGGVPYAKHVDEVILPECSYDSDGVGYVYGDYDWPLTEGVVYDVVWNGTLYRCPAVAEGTTIKLTQAYVDGTDLLAAAPFMQFYPPPGGPTEWDGRMICGVLVVPSPATGTVSVVGYTKVQKVDPMSLPSQPNVYTVDFVSEYDFDLEAFVVAPELGHTTAHKQCVGALEADKLVVARKDGVKGSYYQLVGRPNAREWYFARITNGPVFEVLYWNIDQETVTVTKTPIQPQITGEADQFVVIGEDGLPVAKTVEVGGSGEWKLIRAFTTDGTERSITISEDDNGNPYAVKDIIVRAVVKNTESTTGTMNTFNVNGKQVAGIVSFFGGNTTNLIRVSVLDGFGTKVEVINNRFFSSGHYFTENSIKADYIKDSFDDITTIFMNFSGANPLDAGIEIEVYGK